MGKRTQRASDTRRAAHRRERMNEALTYRLGGATYREIAREMHISVSTASEYVKDALQELTRENAEQVLAMELARYDELLSAHYGPALQGDPAATDRVLAVMARIERLHGVESPREKDGAQETAGMLAQVLQTSLQRLTEQE